MTMTKESLIEIARQCGGRYAYTTWGYHPFTLTELQQFAQRIEQPLQHKINELRFDVEYQQRQIEELEQQVKPLQQRIEKITEKSYSGLNAKNKQIEQLRDALHKAATELTKSGWNCGNLFDEIDKALEQSC